MVDSLFKAIGRIEVSDSDNHYQENNNSPNFLLLFENKFHFNKYMLLVRMVEGWKRAQTV